MWFLPLQPTANGLINDVNEITWYWEEKREREEENEMAERKREEKQIEENRSREEG